MIVSRFESKEGVVYKTIVFKHKNGDPDMAFVIIKPWSIEWIAFKIRNFFRIRGN